MNSLTPDDTPQDSLDSYNGVNGFVRSAYPLNDCFVPLEAAVLVCVGEALHEDEDKGYQYVVEMLDAIAVERPALERLNRYSPELVELFEAMKRSADHDQILNPADPEDHALQGEANVADLMRLGTKLMLPAVTKLNEEKWDDELREWQAHLEKLRARLPKEL